MKNSVPQLYYLHFKGSVDTCYHVDSIDTDQYRCYFHNRMFCWTALLWPRQCELHVEWI